MKLPGFFPGASLCAMMNERGDCMPFNKGEYDKEYNKNNITRKFIPFNKNNPEDVALLEWLNKRDNVTAYVKGLIKNDIRIRSQNGSQAGE